MVDPLIATQINNFDFTMCKKKRLLTEDRKFEISDKTCIQIYIWRSEHLQVDYGQCLVGLAYLFE